MSLNWDKSSILYFEIFLIGFLSAAGGGLKLWGFSFIEFFSAIIFIELIFYIDILFSVSVVTE